MINNKRTFQNHLVVIHKAACRVLKITAVSLGCYFVIANTPLQAAWDSTLPAPGNPVTSQEYGDFTVYSFPYLQNLYEKGAFSGLLNGVGYQFLSPPGLIQDKLVIITGGPGAPSNNNDVCGTACDTAYDYPPSPATFFATTNAPEPSPPITGENEFYDSAWTIEIPALQAFLDGGDPAFMFNLNESSGGDENTLEGQALLLAAQVTLYGGTESAVSFYLGANTALPGMGAAVTSAKWASDGEPEMDPANTVDVANGTESDELYDPQIVMLGNPNGYASMDPRLAYVHGRICVDSANGDFLGFGTCAFLSISGDTINQNLGANSVAFGAVNLDLANLIAGASTDYTLMDVSVWIGGQSDGFEQAFIVSVDRRIPEPSMLVVFGFGLAGLVFMRRRRKLN